MSTDRELPTTTDGERDLAALVGRLITRLREFDRDDKLCLRAAEYLNERRYLSPLRVHAANVPAIPEGSAARGPLTKPWLPAVPVHPEPMMTWSNLERQRIEEYGQECFASGAASAKPFDPEALIRAVLPGGHSCAPQEVADDIREWARSHATPARVPLAEEQIEKVLLAESATTGEEPG